MESNIIAAIIISSLIISMIFAFTPSLIILAKDLDISHREGITLNDLCWGYIWRCKKLNLFGKIFLETLIFTLGLPAILLAYILVGILHLAVMVFILLFVKKEKDNE